VAEKLVIGLRSCRRAHRALDARGGRGQPYRTEVIEFGPTMKTPAIRRSVIWGDELQLIGEREPWNVVGLLGDVRKEHELVIAEGVDLAGQETK
jgi:hypothetical protein